MGPTKPTARKSSGGVLITPKQTARKSTCGGIIVRPQRKQLTTMVTGAVLRDSSTSNADAGAFKSNDKSSAQTKGSESTFQHIDDGIAGVSPSQDGNQGGQDCETEASTQMGMDKRITRQTRHNLKM